MNTEHGGCSVTITGLGIRQGFAVLAVVVLVAWGMTARAAGLDEVTSSPPAAADAAEMEHINRLIGQLAGEDADVRQQAVHALVDTGDAATLSRLERALDDADRATRVAVKPIKTLLKNKLNLASGDEAVRRAAAGDLGTSGQPVARAWLETAAVKEPQYWVRYAMEEGAALLRLAEEDPAARIAAAEKLGELKSQNALPALKELAQQLSGNAGALESNGPVRLAVTKAIERIELWSTWAGVFETLFRGVSLGSILLIMSLGLAIVFGLMGVINMAHGELMMVGAYATFMTQELFKAYLPPSIFDAYFLASLPVAFLVAGACGLFIEATVIRFLYGRPLETMLATWGVSLVLIQLARVLFGDVTAVTAPAWLSGGVQVLAGVYFPYNRLFIIALSIVCVIGIYLALFRSSLGLRVRAVTQNRNMSACLGIPTRKVDAYTFAFGSGLAGLAGCALTLVGNVEPGLGQNYIVDSFMVVVTGGVGKLAGTIVAALGIGSLNKFLEPSFGAVYGKVFILGLVILFLQRRPSGLFAIKGRHAD
ncbi:putative urea ABC transporter, permease protein UrtB [Nitrospira lenta]|uniref:Putative urea ABC transporter, permease protein UrtB n=1 Tax=Nitrospira lenta TaxID=1436998 RepID=A0A0K2GY47_9BACT|nr:putative urea ABC transporter/permease protein UrtB [Nitrospira lenta]SPP64271.1 putative urea ABC transporter, permease protein UrtB [Nitrospira lenta]